MSETGEMLRFRCLVWCESVFMGVMFGIAIDIDNHTCLQG